MCFLAEDLHINIVPNFTLSQAQDVHLLSSELAGFTAAFTQTSPLWIALYLKKCGKCSMVPEERTGQLVNWRQHQPKRRRDITTASNQTITGHNPFFDHNLFRARQQH